MKITEFLSKEDIFFEENEINKNEAIIKLCEIISEKHDLDFNFIKDSVFQREKKLTTGIGSKIAVPHARIENIDSCKVVFMINKKGIDFDAMDNKDVNIIILILSPKNKVKNHIALMSKISYLLTEKEYQQKLLKSTSQKEVYNILNQ